MSNFVKFKGVPRFQKFEYNYGLRWLKRKRRTYISYMTFLLKDFYQEDINCKSGLSNCGSLCVSVTE